MASRRAEPWAELSRLQEQLGRMVEEALLGARRSFEEGQPAGSWRPVVDVLEEDDEVVCFVELPGVERDDVQLEVDGTELEISGRRRVAGTETTFQRLEGRYGHFERRIELPTAVDPDGVSASLRRGVLEVRLPKRRGARIEITEDEP